jgi:hypothetical protein
LIYIKTKIENKTFIYLSTKKKDPSFECSFEKDKCSWTDDTRLDLIWERKNASLSTNVWQPQTDASLNANGYYLYLDTSAPRKKGQKAGLISPSLPLSNKNCIEFSYYMYGDQPGSLTLYGKYDPFMPNSPLFNRTGSFGNYWLLEALDFSFPIDQASFIVI